MISSFNHRLLLIEQALTNNGAVLAQLQLLELHDCKPDTDSSQSDCEDSDHQELDRLKDWVVRLRAQVARTERRIVRLRTSIDRHDAQLFNIKSRIIWSSGGCAVVRPHTTWDDHADSNSTQRELAANRSPMNGKWLPTVQIPHQKLTRATTSSGPWSARRVMVDSSGVTPQLSQSFTSLSSVSHRPHSTVSVRVSAKATSSYDHRSFELLCNNLQHSTNEVRPLR